MSRTHRHPLFGPIVVGDVCANTRRTIRSDGSDKTIRFGRINFHKESSTGIFQIESKVWRSQWANVIHLSPFVQLDGDPILLTITPTSALTKSTAVTVRIGMSTTSIALQCKVTSRKTGIASVRRDLLTKTFCAVHCLGDVERTVKVVHKARGRNFQTNSVTTLQSGRVAHQHRSSLNTTRKHEGHQNSGPNEEHTHGKITKTESVKE
mmetsp:Transcript_26192/g.65832  ORF Transcript_26192/g.65832 Transcript_26192/m.65832 type:complete len:208 (+) Transcript_26192:3012-3635(+)